MGQGNLCATESRESGGGSAYPLLAVWNPEVNSFEQF